MRCFAIVTLLAVAAAPGAAQPRKEITIWTARAIATVLAEVGSEFERTSGYRLNLSSGLSSDFARRVAAGEQFDVMVSGLGVVDQFVREGTIDATTRTVIARSGIGVEVRAGAPKPDVSTVEAFKRALLQAKSIAYLRVGSGFYLDTLFKQLGIAEAIMPRVTRPDADIVSELVARGEVELGIVVITQILTTPGVAFVGPLPREIQSYITFTAGVSSKSNVPEAAKQLIAFLTGPTALPVIRTQGMERPPR
jgi:molybdate transport system substrate-binding protein